MKANDLREKSTSDLRDLRASLDKDLFSYRMKNAVGTLENVSLLGKTKKDIARIEQILSERSQKAEGDKA